MHAVCLEGTWGAWLLSLDLTVVTWAHSRMPCMESFCSFLWPEIWPHLLLWPPSLGSELGPQGTLRTSFGPLLRPRRARPEWVTPCHGLCLRASLALMVFPNKSHEKARKDWGGINECGFGVCGPGFNSRLSHSPTLPYSSEPKLSCLQKE